MESGNMDFEDLDFPKFIPKNIIKTYGKKSKLMQKPSDIRILRAVELKPVEKVNLSAKKVEDLTTKNAVNFLLAGTLTSKVCRYCLSVTEELYELENNVEIATKGGLYSVAIKDMIASFHPFKIADDPNFPNKICDQCLDRTIKAYLFTQQCEQTERALRNCFEDINAKFLKLDPLEHQQTHRRGRKKVCENHNVIAVDHFKVIDYADPIIHIINTSSEAFSSEPAINPLECLKCCQVLPNVESLANHSKIHPASMWYTCRICAQSFPKLYLIKRHYRDHRQENPITDDKQFECKQCSETNKNYYEHLQHLEKHHFKTVLEHLLYKQMNNLCAVCMDKDSLVPLDDIVCLHGGPPELMGDMTIQSILDYTLPELQKNSMDEYTGSKVCEKCLNSAITSYTFMHNTYFSRKRLSTCVNHMLDNLQNITPEKTLCVEIAKETILPILDQMNFVDKEDTNNESDDDIRKEIFLEDEYRIKSEDEIEPESETELKLHVETDSLISKTEVKKEVHLNGYQHDVCSEFLTFNKKPKTHKKVSQRFTCPLCDKHFLSDYFVKKHILKHVSNKVKCSPCGTEFGNKFSLNEHTKYAHVLFQSDYRACNICGRGFAKADKLKHHEKQHMNKACLLCDKVFKTQRYHDMHMKRHIPKFMVHKKMYGKSCSFCEIQCSNENQLSLHVNKVHLQIKPYSCDMCDKKFYTEYNLRFHKKIHSRFSKEKCKFCGRIVKSRKSLVIHIRKHIGVTPHCCQLCNQAFYSQAMLKNHMNLLHGGNLLCKICKHVSVSKNDLKMHVAKAHCIL